MPSVWIEPSDRDGLVELVAFAKSDVDLSADFTLEVVRSANGNSSRTRQAGRVDLRAGEARRLSVTVIGPVAAEPGWEARVSLVSDGEMIASARTSDADQTRP